MFYKIAIFHEKGEFSKIIGSICNISIDAANTCNTLPRLAVSNILIIVKLKQHLKYKGHVYFKPFRPYVIYQALTYLKSSERMFRFFDIDVENQLENGSVTK